MSQSNFFQSIGALPSDSAENRAQKNFLVFLAAFMSGGGIVWGALSLSYGLTGPSLIPLGYVVISLINILAWSVHKNFYVARILQIGISLILPITFQFVIGGLGSSGGVALWSLLALIGSLTFKERNESLIWLFIFLVGNFIGYYFDDVAQLNKPEILPEFSVLFLFINLMMISTIVFILTLSYTTQLSKTSGEAVAALDKLKVNEVAMRKLAAKQLEDAEKLMKVQKEQEERTRILKKSRAQMMALTQKQASVNEKLLEAQDVLKTQEARFRKVVENAPLIILTIDRQGFIELAEGSGLAKLGLTQGNLIDQRASKLLGQHEKIEEAMIEVFNGNSTIINHVIKDQTFELHFIPIKDDHGEVKVLLVATDINEQEAAKQKLNQALDKARKSEQSMRKVAEEQLLQSEKLILAEKKLQKSLQEVQVSKQRLEDTQSQLVNNEKMASLGQLTAGIAHEINNPINFIFNGVDTLSMVVEELMPLVDQVKTLNNDNVKEVLSEIEEYKEDSDIDELTEDLHALLDDIKKGAVRTMEIVRGLRVFSRLDEEEQKQANINENLDATLVLLRNKTKDRIEVKKYYDESLGETMCYPGQLNQVFMNILSNAIQAMPEDFDKGEISIYTENKDKDIIIRIKDNGSGMSEEVQKRVFEPFYTTKDVGVGTGLGLSISFGIIEKHNGQISVSSKEGQGTEFVITLPKG